MPLLDIMTNVLILNGGSILYPPLQVASQMVTSRITLWTGGRTNQSLFFFQVPSVRRSPVSSVRCPPSLPPSLASLDSLASLPRRSYGLQCHLEVTPSTCSWGTSKTRRTFVTRVGLRRAFPGCSKALVSGWHVQHSFLLEVEGQTGAKGKWYHASDGGIGWWQTGHSGQHQAMSTTLWLDGRIIETAVNWKKHFK